VAAVSIDPEVEGLGDEGLEEAAVRSAETMHLGEALEAEVGTTAVVGRVGGESPETLTAMLPFATVAWHGKASTVSYRMATMVPNRGTDGSDGSGAAGYLPRLAAHNGSLTMERGTHQEIGWERRNDDSGVAVLVYADNISNPVIEALGHFAVSGAAASTGALFDSGSNLLRAAGPSFSTAGVRASVEHRLPGGNNVRLSYASGSALVMPAMTRLAPLAAVFAGARPRRAQTYAISLSGTLDGTNTHWRASYSWQPEDTVTPVDAFAQDANAPFLNVHIRQPIHLTRDGVGGLEALLDVRNLLAEGYQPYILSDGSVLIFAQDQRSLRAGLAFTF
jgi:hypothetical protein